MSNAKNFDTDRIRRFRSRLLSESEECTISRVEGFGCEVVQITKTAAGRGWSYTVGVYDTCGQPELITVGLIDKTALVLLNKAVNRLRQGISLSHGRHRELVGEVECEFRPVDPKWIKQLMHSATWYYGSDEFPVLQAVYPDLKNRFPEEPDFEIYFQQPLMQPDAPMTVFERDFWASTDPRSSMFDWKFPDPPHTMVFLSETVNSGTEPVTYVSHDIEDGSWQFLGDSMSDGGGPVLSCFHHPIDKDSTLNELADMPVGWSAERSKPGEPWMGQKRESQ